MKKMKKSMFITTLMMVVLLVVALSTSTFAWFSANDTVSATQTTMTAATSSAANIAIGWGAGDNYMGSSISFANGTDLAPAIPTYRPTVAGYDTEAQYVSTKEAIGSTFVPFAYGGEEAVDNVNVIYVETENTVTIGDATAANYTGLIGTATALQRIYRTQYAKAQHYRMTNSTITTGIIQYNEEYAYRQIVNDGSAVNPHDITETEANLLTLFAEEYNGNNADAPAIVGQRIYEIAEVYDVHKIADIGEVAPAGYIPGGINADITADAGPTFVTVVTELGVVDTNVGTEYYINETDAKTAPFLCPAAVAGDKIYNVRAAEEAKVRTVYTEFDANGLWTNSIDQAGKFRGAGLQTPMITLNNGEEEETEFSDTFYIKNNNALGSPAAKITLKTKFEGQAATLIRFAFFVKNEGETSFNYVSTLSSEADAATYYGSIIKGSLSTDLPKYNTDGENAKDLVNFIQIDPKKSAAIKVVAWYDGVALSTNESGRAADFVFEFSAA